MKAKDLKKVIRTMDMVANDCDSMLNMSEYIVQCTTHLCGTVHCFAGWYLIASRLEMGDTFRPRMFSCPTSFETGKIKMEKVLNVSLQKWANENPNLWGNRYGDDVFTNQCAFKSVKRPGGATNLNDIIDHLKEVYWRLFASEIKSTVSNIFNHVKNKGGTK